MFPSQDALQSQVDDFLSRIRDQRKTTQMTLGQLLSRLEQLKKEDEFDVGMLIDICNPHAYRGYYADIAFETSRTLHTIDHAIALVRGCIGQSFTGYKGGTYFMGEDAPVWIACWGCCGPRLMGVELDAENKYVCKLVTKNEDI